MAKYPMSYVAIDTNMVIDMARISENYKGKRPNGNGYYQKIRDVKRIASIGKTLKFEIVPTVFDEISKKLKPSEIEFLRKFCAIVEPKNKLEFASETYKLAQTYVKRRVMKPLAIKEKNATNKNKSEKIYKEGVPSRDSLAMAEASVLGLNFLTLNYHDFIWYEENANANHKGKNSNQRQKDIEAINIEKNYVFYDSSGKKYCSKPIDLEGFLNTYREPRYKSMNTANVVIKDYER